MKKKVGFEFILTSDDLDEKIAYMTTVGCEVKPVQLQEGRTVQYVSFYFVGGRRSSFASFYREAVEKFLGNFNDIFL